jgi:Domain of unknown function (DUF4386)
MTTARRAGRTAGVLIIVQGICGFIYNFVLLEPATAPPGFLVNASAHALQLGIAVLLGLVTGALAAAIAIAVLPTLRKYSEALALWFLALAIASLSLAVVENGTVMSLLSLSQAYAATNGADPATFAGLRGVVAASRNWAHYTHLIVGGAALLVFYITLYRFALIPRVLAACGIAAFVLQLTTVSMPFLGGRVMLPLLAPVGIAHLALAIWLIVKGFADPKPSDLRQPNLAGTAAM